jgi:uncharacterized protein (TIGR03086 family)
MIDITPATERVGRLLEAVTEADLDRPTPCPDAGVGDLIDHIATFADRFAGAARKDVPQPSPPPKPAKGNLPPDWRDQVIADLAALANAWQEPAAWEGMTSIGGLDLPGGVAGLVALDELIVHGWDIAVATGQPYDPPASEVEAATSFVAGFDAPRDGRLFGPVVDVAESASPLDRLLGLTGRDPAWSPPAT